MRPRPMRTMALAAVCLASGGCASARTAAPTAGVPHAQVGSVAPPGAPTIPDSRIVTVLLCELRADSVVKHESMGVGSVGGIVTLTGTVSSRLAHDRTLDRARLVRGVRAIVDRLVVAPIPRPDYEIEFTVAGALSHDPVTIGQRIAAQAHGAVVRLYGDVDSNAARRAAVNDVLAIPGIIDVIDDLAIVPVQRSDARIADEEERVIADDPLLDASRLRMQVENGVVRLAGHVRTGAERARAEGDAHAVSPEGVDVHGIAIDGGYDDGTLRGGDVPVYSDSGIAIALLEALTRDPRVTPFHPSIDVRDGAVAVSGIAPTPDAARAIEEDAHNVLGVTRVRDALESLPEAGTPPDLGVTSLQAH